MPKKNPIPDMLPIRFIRKHINQRIVRFVMYVLLLDLAFVFLFPFLYLFITSFKSPEDLMDSTVNWLISGVHIKNYMLSWEHLEYPSRFMSTVMVTLMCTLGHLVCCSFVGYGFARFKFRGKNALIVLLLLAIIVPPQTIITPIFIIFSRLGMTDTVLPLILPTWLGFGLKGGLFIFIFRQFYLSLPASLEEAACIDGCGSFSAFFKIMLPTSRSSLLVCLVLSTVWHWNDYFEPGLYLNSQHKFLLPMMLPRLYDLMKGSGTQLGGSAGSLDLVYTEGVAMAATVIVLLPIFLFYFFVQRKFIQGVERSGITGE